MKLIAIVAHDRNLLIGNRGALPWSLPEDLQNFKNCTTGHPIIMGGTTFLSIWRPLPNRRNMVLSSKMEPGPGIEVFASIPLCLTALDSVSDMAFVIGGSMVYDQFIAQGLLDEIWVSVIPGEHSWDSYFPEYRDAFRLVETRHFNTFDFCKHQRIK